MRRSISLEVTSRSDEAYKKYRDRHYIPNKGSHGQQIHFMCAVDGVPVGIISGGSSVYSVKARDDFFSIPAGKHDREKLFLPSIINNTVFRLEHDGSIPNLGTQFLRLFREVTPPLWEALYRVKPIGFETFVIPGDGRFGSLYMADNWFYAGDTVGRTKAHTSAQGLLGKRGHVDTEKKMIFVKKIKGARTPTDEYVSCWRRQTPEEKVEARRIALVRKTMMNQKFERIISIKEAS